MSRSSLQRKCTLHASGISRTFGFLALIPDTNNKTSAHNKHPSDIVCGHIKLWSQQGQSIHHIWTERSSHPSAILRSAFLSACFIFHSSFFPSVFFIKLFKILHAYTAHHPILNPKYSKDVDTGR